jgi:hypothetical protein
VVEFVVDKIPWVDSFWDFFHTLVRPAGALGISLVAANAAGLTSGPTIALGLASVALSLSSHLTKSGLRLIINASPEPFTNILASLVEDLGVCLLALLLLKAPVTGLAASLSLLVGTWIVLPRLGRLVKTSIVLLWKKYLGPKSAPRHQGPLPTALTVAQETQLAALLSTTQPKALWSVLCASGKAHGLPGHRAHWSGTLISPAGHPGTLVFLTKGWFRRRGVRFSLAGASVRQESTFLSENLVIHRAEDGLHLVFRFTRAEAPIVTRLTGQLHTQLGITAPFPVTPVPLPTPSLQLQSGHGPSGTATPTSLYER